MSQRKTNTTKKTNLSSSKQNANGEEQKGYIVNERSNEGTESKSAEASKTNQKIEKDNNENSAERHVHQSSTQKSNGDTETKSNKSDKVFIAHVWWLDALLFIGGTILLGGVATLLGGKMFNFQDYKMPPGTVPKIVFPIAWAIIYIAIGVSTFLMWRDKEIKSKDRKINLIIYFIHMFFNILWPLFFFRLDLPIFAAVWLLLMIFVACTCMYRYFVCNLPAGIIFNIYTLWLIYALYLNLGLVLINF